MPSTRSALPRAIALCLVAGGLAGAACVHAADWEHKLDASVQRRAATGEAIDVLIRPHAAPHAKRAQQPMVFGERVRRTVEVLRAHAEQAHGPLLHALRADGVEARSLWVANAVVARLTPAQLEAIAQRTDVARIESDAPRAVALPRAVPGAGIAKVDGVEPNIAAMDVPDAWASGARGGGVVVGGQDTGYHWSHPALRDGYRGWNGSTAEHDHNWYDAVRSHVNPGLNPCGFASAEPCDDGSHGTHTMGTAVGGGDAGDHIGVAPDARWIGCRNMDRGVGRPSTYIDCFQFFLAPTDLAGNDPRPELAPHVIVNSWGCPLGPPPQGEECAVDSLDETLHNVRAAGILTVVAAGNGAPGCGTIADPPAISADAFTVAATDNAGVIAPFSLWGPVSVDASGRVKPDAAAPGVAVRSSVPDGGYAAYSGTSMATPAVAGVAALMLGANPLLMGQPDELGRLLRGSATATLHAADCGALSGSESPNAVFGHGLVDASAAVDAATRHVVGPGHSGAWYDPARSGEGWILQILDDGSATLVWFTFPETGSDAAQEWLIGAGGRIEGERIVFDDLLTVRGGRFGAGFDAGAVQSTRWGTLEIRIEDCGRAALEYAGPEGYGSATRSVQRLTALHGIPCGQPFRESTQPAAARSGAWFDPARAGEGWIVEALEGGLAALYWFTFDPEGRPAWLFGVGSLTGERLVVEDMLRMTGTQFGEGFDAGALEHAPWGRLEIDFDGCNTGQLAYASTDADWGSGTHALARLTRVLGSGCE